MNIPVDCKVGGMTCGNCALTITNFLRKQGVEDSVANAATGDLHFTVKEGSAIEPLLQGIRELGYSILDESNQEETESLNREWIYFLISLLCWMPLMAHMFLDISWLHEVWFQLICCIPVYLIGVYYFGVAAWRSIKNRMLSMDVLIFAGSSAAFIYSVLGWILYPEQVHQYLFFETTASIITLVLLGNLLESYTVKSTGKAMKSLLIKQNSIARLVMTDSLGKESIMNVDIQHLRIGDILQLNQGDQVPVDGVILHGEARLDERFMTGESLSRSRQPGMHVLGGSVVEDGQIRVKVTAIGKQTALSRIIQLVNEAQAIKPPLQKLADRISAVFVPLVLLISLLTFLGSFFIFQITFTESIMRTIAVMVIACPCAMGLATPAAVMVGLGRATKLGILIKGGDFLESFRTLKRFVFDKTGTLTEGVMEVKRVNTAMDISKFQQVVVSLEQYSSHPLAKNLCKLWTPESLIAFSDITEHKGQGIEGTDPEGVRWQIGSARWVHQELNDVHDIHVFRNSQWVGGIDINDTLRPQAAAVIDWLHTHGYKTAMLSGDTASKCHQIARETGIQEVYAEQLPHQKFERMDAWMQEGPTVMIGDGMNDSPALARATLGISLSNASDIARQHAGVLLLNNRLSSLPLAIGLGKFTYRTIQQNLFWAFSYNIIAVPVAALGYLTPGWAAGIMAISDLVLIINSLRLRYRSLSAYELPSNRKSMHA